jgi:hypothetical protein
VEATSRSDDKYVSDQNYYDTNISATESDDWTIDDIADVMNGLDVNSDSSAS